jgi:hypothetical protein
MAVGCGGIAEGRSPEPEPDSGEGAASAGKAPEKSGGTLPVEGDTELGECRLGTPEAGSDTCPWLFERRCYDSRDMACNCACPRSRDSLCLSGFEAGPFGRVEVSCD